MRKRRIAVVFPTAWDERQLAALPDSVRARFELLFDEPCDEEVRWDFDVLGHVASRAREWRGKIDGVFSSSDYPGAVAAAAIAAELGLPGSPPASVVRAAHKLAAREVLAQAVPEVVPRFRLVVPEDERTWPEPGEFPCFVKPVKGSFSLFARRIASREDLADFVRRPELDEYRQHYLGLFEALTQRYLGSRPGTRGLLAEGCLQGRQFTVEGWVQAGCAHLLGIVDTAFHPGTQSFASFDYPSLLPAAVQARAAEVAGRAALALGLERTFFNVELFYDPESGKLGLIEVNPRLCGQFGDLYAKVDGASGYALALELASGGAPLAARGRGRFPVAASRPLRCFQSATVVRAPSAAELGSLERLHPSTLLWSDVTAGDRLQVSAVHEDGQSARYAVVNLGADSRAELDQRVRQFQDALGYEFRIG